MKGLILGIAIIIIGILSAPILMDATATVMLIPLGIVCIVEWYKNGDRIFE